MPRFHVPMHGEDCCFQEDTGVCSKHASLAVKRVSKMLSVQQSEWKREQALLYYEAAQVNKAETESFGVAFSLALYSDDLVFTCFICCLS